MALPFVLLELAPAGNREPPTHSLCTTEKRKTRGFFLQGVRMFGVLLMPLLAKVTEGCTTWKKGPCVIPFRVDGTLHTECLNRKACMIFSYSFDVFFPPGRCLMNSPGSQRWDAKYISYLHHHYIVLIELRLHPSNTIVQR